MEITGKSEGYLAPEVHVCVYAMEKGFAISIPTESYGYQEEWYDKDRDQVVGNENYKEGFSF